MNLRKLCKESKITCFTCSQSYKNYKSEEVWDLYCHGHFIWQDHICLNWKNENEIDDDDYISDEIREVLLQYQKDKADGILEVFPLRDLRK